MNARLQVLSWCTALAVGALPAAACAQSAPRAVWLWESDTFQLLDRPAARDSALAFLAERRISVVYVYADSYRGRNPLRDEPEKYRALVEQLNARGMKPYALLGSRPLNTPAYILEENRATAEAMFQAVLDYNDSSEPAERFTGLNVDIEPYLLPDWDANRHQRAVQYLRLSQRFMEMTGASGQALEVGPAIPFWFDSVGEITLDGVTKPLSQHTQDIYDYVALMDYRDFARGPDGIIDHGADEIGYAGGIGKSVVIGVETAAESLDKVTFLEEGAEAMEAELKLVEEAWRGHQGFGGFAIHHYRSLRILSRSGP